MAIAPVTNHGVLAFGHFDYRDRPDPADREKFFLRNLLSSMQELSNLDDLSFFLAKNRNSINELSQVFRLDDGFDTLAVARINIMVSKLCALPSGRRLLEKLLSFATENNFQIRFRPGSEFAAGHPEIDASAGKIFIPIYCNFDAAGLSVERRSFARLTLVDGKYGVKQMIYPPFIIFAHELTHGLHHMKRYCSLRSQFSDIPSLNGSLEEWRTFAIKVCKHYKCAINLEEQATIGACMAASYRVLAIREFHERFGFMTTNPITLAHRNAGYLWNNFQEEESLTIIGDGEFSDRIFLEEARASDLLTITDGFDGGSIFRWGHGFFSNVQTVIGYMQGDEFPECVQLFIGSLPPDLS